MRGASLTHPVLASFFIWGVSLTHPVLALFFCGEFLLHILCWLFSFLFFFPSFLNLGSFSYTSGAGFIFMQGVSLSHPVMALFLTWEFLLHIPRWPHFYAGSFSFTSRNGFIFNLGVSLTHPALASFLCRAFLLHIPYWLYF